jgi:hypothetical protein
MGKAKNLKKYFGRFISGIKGVGLWRLFEVGRKVKKTVRSWQPRITKMKNLKIIGFMRSVRSIKTDIENAQKVKKESEIIEKLLDEKEDFDRAVISQVKALRSSSKTSIKHLQKLHEKLEKKFPVYRTWHQNPRANFINTSALAVFAFTALVSGLLIYGPLYKRALAEGLICVWTGATSTSFSDASNWNDCSGTTPDATDTVKFTSVATRDLNLTESVEVAEIRSLSADSFTRTFNTAGFDVKTSGPFTWEAGTLTLGASQVDVSGNLSITAGTFNYNTSNFKLTGAASNLTTKSDGTTSFYDLTIDKADSATAVTVVDYNFNVRRYLNVITGTLNGAGRTLTMSVDNSRYQIGANSGGGTASVKFTNTGYVDGSGGTANNVVELNGAAKTLYWNGSANIKFLALTDGTLTIQSGKIIIPNDPANGKISCAAGKTLNLTGASPDRW